MCIEQKKGYVLKSIVITIALWSGYIFQLEQSWAAETIRLGWGTSPPFYSEELPKGGVQAHIVREAYATVGVKVEYDILPWKRAYIMANSGEIDGSAGWLKTPQREIDVLYSNSIAKGCYVFFHKRDTAFDWKTEQDLGGWSIGTTMGYSQTKKLEAIKQKGVDFKLQVASSDLANMKKLVSKRVDLFVCNQDVGKNILHQNFPTDAVESITIHPKPMYCDTLHVIFSRKTPDKSQRLITLLNKGIEELHASGRYAEIMEAFNNGAYSKKLD